MKRVVTGAALMALAMGCSELPPPPWENSSTSSSGGPQYQDADLPAPPEGQPPPWMSKRPAGIRAFLDAFDAAELDLDALRAFGRPVYFAVGGRSNPDFFGRMAGRLSEVFADVTLETFPDRHHFDPPHRVEPERLASSLLALWDRA